MSATVFHGKLVRLGNEDPQVMAEAFMRWNQGAEYYRLLDSDPASLWSTKKFEAWFEKDLDSASPNDLFFSIRALADEKLIGFCAFDGINWASRDTYVAIGIGEQDFWSKGYGTDAMRLMLHYAFTELNLHRVSLTVFEYNPRGIRSYEKCGFKYEGRTREFIQRDGKRWDILHMGILRSDWESMKEN